MASDNLNGTLIVGASGMSRLASQDRKTGARLAILGDVMLGRLVSEEIPHRQPESFWGDVLPELHAADAVLANLECCISGRGSPWQKTPKVFHFRAVPAAIDVLKAAHVSYVSLGNNHVLDFGNEALADTISLLDDAGIAHAGAGMTRFEAERPAWLSVKGMTIAAFSFVDHERPFAATDSRPGTVYVDPERDPGPWPGPRIIADTRASGADIIVASAHLGPNMVQRPSKMLRDYKKQLIAQGVTIIHGHSAHVFQGIETVGRSVILHDTGDFLDDYAVDPDLRNDWSFLFLLDVGLEGVENILLRPVRLRLATVHLATGSEFDAICERMQSLSAELGATLVRCEEGLRLG